VRVACLLHVSPSGVAPPAGAGPHDAGGWNADKSELCGGSTVGESRGGAGRRHACLVARSLMSLAKIAMKLHFLEVGEQWERK
jgi:hypothetical protein